MGIPYAEVIGDPITHSKSPAIHKYWLEKLGLEGDYRAVRVRPGELPAYLAARRADPDWRGCNVTMPYKVAIAALLDRIDPSAEWAGSANCVYWDGRQLWGCNTDASGLVSALGPAEVYRNPVAVIGAGAAARMAMWCLAMEEVGEIRLVARNPDRAKQILSEQTAPGRTYALDDAQEAFSNVTLIMNATPLGMDGFAEMPQSVLEAIRFSSIDCSVMDMVYHPLDTQLLTAAKAYGRRTIDGLVMLIGQAVDSFRHFFDGEPPRTLDAELRALLSR